MKPMKSFRLALLLATMLVVTICTNVLAEAPRLLSYQGRLTDASGNPLSGTYDLNFRIYDALTEGNQLWHETHNGVVVTAGLFSVVLGSIHTPSPELPDVVFSDTALWLGITVGAGPELTPRVRLTTNPYSFRVATVDGARGGTIADSLIVAGPIRIASGGLTFPDGTTQVTQAGASNGLPMAGGTMTGPITSVGDPPITMGKGNFGTNNINSGVGAFVAGESDTASGDYCTVSGGFGNKASGENPDTTTGSPTVSKSGLLWGMGGTVGGGYGNDATGSYSTVGGGKFNSATDAYSTVAGGLMNAALRNSATVAGGFSNYARALSSTIGGGEQNWTLGNRSVVSGGYKDTASGECSVVSGGSTNAADGDMAVVPGGRYNRAVGDQSFAAGDHAQALHEGAFVWASGSQGAGQPFASTAPYQFLIHASGGVGIGTNTPQSQLDVNGTIRTGGFRMQAGAILGGVLTCDLNGAASWQYPTSTSGGWVDDGAYVRLQASTDKVGIGTASPTEKLDVAGTVRTTGFKMPTGASSGYVLTSDANGVGAWQASSGATNGWVDDGTNVRLQTSTDGVGIGVTTPSEKLEVGGKIRSSGAGQSITISGQDVSISSSRSMIRFPHDTLYTPEMIAIGSEWFNNSGCGLYVNKLYSVINEGNPAPVGIRVRTDWFGPGGWSIGGISAIADGGAGGATGIAVGAEGAEFCIGLDASASSEGDVLGARGTAIGAAGSSTYATGLLGGAANANFSRAVEGIADNSTESYGGFFIAKNSVDGYGIWAVALDNTTKNVAGWFSGDVVVTGVLSKGGGAFKIDHPLDPENKYLQHSFVESPDMMNIYNGNVITDADGIAVVTLPDYFTALNRDCRYQLTVIGQFAQAIIGEKIANNRFTIKTDKPNVEVSWQVTGIRQDRFADANRIQVEVVKKSDERGRYLHPQAYGLGEERGIDYENNQAAHDAQAVTPAMPQR